jgi:hypothetical protein
VTFDAGPHPRSTLFARARYISTRRPEEFVDDAGLVLTHRRSTNYVVEASVSHDLTPRTRGRLAYTFNFDDYGSLPAGRGITSRVAEHAAVGEIVLSHSDRTTVGFETSGKVMVGEDETSRAIARGVFWAGTAGARWSHFITPDLTMVLMAGPRVSLALPESFAPSGRTPLDVELAPELLASVTYRRKEQRLSAAYVRSAYRGVGASGFINTESIEGRALALFRERLRVSARPVLYRNTLAGVRAVGHRIDSGAVFQLTHWMAIEATYLYKRQSRGLSLVDLDVATGRTQRVRNSVMVGVSMQRPLRMR